MKKMFVTGNVGADPNTRYDTNGNMFVSFSVGVSVGTKMTPKTDWVEISCSGKLADTVQKFVRKGNKLLIEGFPTVNPYINKEGKAAASLRIYANNLEFLGRKEEVEPVVQEPIATNNTYIQSNSSEEFEANQTYMGENDFSSTIKSDEIPF